MTAKLPEEGKAPGGRMAGGARGALPVFDVTVPNTARMWDYWLGGKDNFAADRQAAQKVVEALPSLPDAVRRCRRFLAVSVHKLAADYGIRQFLDIGPGLPTVGNTHEVAQRAAPDSRAVYVDFDPVVSTHAMALLASHPLGKTDYIQADLRDTGTILDETSRTLDLSRPVAVVLTNILHFIPDADDPYRIVSRLMDAVPPGSFLVIVHGASDLSADTIGEGTRLYNQLSPTPLTMRSYEQVTRFFDGLEILDTGAGPGRISGSGGGQLSYYGIGKKP